MYQWDFSFLWGYRVLFLRGIGVSLLFTVVVVVCGIALGLMVGLGRIGLRWPVRFLARAYVEIFRCTPLLVQLVWFFYALPILLNVEISATTAAILSMSLYGSAFYAEIFRAGIQSIGAGQSEAGAALGLKPRHVMWKIVLPQAIRRVIPPLLSQSILQFKNTSLLSTLAVADLLYQGQYVAHETYRPLEVYTFIAVTYFVVLFPLTIGVQFLERHLAKRS